jgi:hypothetical protein
MISIIVRVGDKPLRRGARGALVVKASYNLVFAAGMAALPSSPTTASLA